jgi:2-iminobutanoate/2-iminopropanoate deaminase
MKRQIVTEQAPSPAGPYSQGIVSGDLIFVAGQGPLDPSSGSIVGETIEEQTALTLDNVQAILEAVGSGMADVVKATVHLADLADFHAFNGVYEQYFPEPRPVRTTVGSNLIGIKVEVDVIAVRQGEL